MKGDREEGREEKMKGRRERKERKGKGRKGEPGGRGGGWEGSREQKNQSCWLRRNSQREAEPGRRGAMESELRTRWAFGQEKGGIREPSAASPG